MTTFTDEQARQQLPTLLDSARREGEVRIRTNDGQEFAVRPVDRSRSPLEIPGVDLNLSQDDIVKAVREGREAQDR